MGLIGLIFLAFCLALWWNKLIISIRPKTAQWYLEEALKMDANPAKYFKQPENQLALDSNTKNRHLKLEDLSKEELVVIIRKLSE